MPKPTAAPNANPVGRILSGSGAEFIFGCSNPDESAIQLGTFVRAAGFPADTTVIGVVSDIRVIDDSFARQLVAGDAKDEYIREQRERRLTPLEVTALHAGYLPASGEARHRLPPRPGAALEAVFPCTPEEIRTFLRHPKGGWRFDFLPLLLAAGASNEVLAECVWQAAAAQPPDPQNTFRTEAARELARLLAADLQRLYSLLPQLS